MPVAAETSRMADELVIRAAARADVAAVSRLDSRITGMSKADYWEDMFERYGKRPDRFFLIAEAPGGGVVGFQRPPQAALTGRQGRHHEGAVRDALRARQADDSIHRAARGNSLHVSVAAA